MTIQYHGLPATRRLILKGAGYGRAASALAIFRSASFRPLPRPTTNIRRMPSNKRAKPTPSSCSMAEPPRPSDKVKLDAPEIAENGAVVPVSVSTTLADVTSISFLVADNPNALAASYRIPPGTMPSVANRLKMAKTSNVTAIVEAGGKLYSATREVKVTVGGCGG